MGTEDPRSDADLLRAARVDAQAFRVFYDRHSRAVFDWCASRTGSRDQALDLTAETFAEAFRVSGRYHGARGSARAWLFGIATNLMRRLWRTRRIETRARERIGALEATRALVDPAGDEIDKQIDDRRLAPELERALESLRPTQRCAVELRIVQESSYAEIAQRLGCSPGAARVMVFRGLRRLSDLLGGDRAVD